MARIDDLRAETIEETRTFLEYSIEDHKQAVVGKNLPNAH